MRWPTKSTWITVDFGHSMNPEFNKAAVHKCFARQLTNNTMHSRSSVHKMSQAKLLVSDKVAACSFPHVKDTWCFSQRRLIATKVQGVICATHLLSKMI